MRIKSILFSILIIIVIILAIGTINNDSGKKITGWEKIQNDKTEIINFPFYKIIKEPANIIIKNEINFENYNLLVIPKVDGGGMQVFIEEDLIYETGDIINSTGNIWNYKHVVNIPKKYIDNNIHEVKIKLFGLYDYGISENPYLVNQKDSLLLIGLSNFFNNGFFYVAFGASIILTFIILILGFSKKEFRESYFYLGLAILFTGIYMLDFVYRPTGGNIFLFLMSKKIIMVSAYMASIFIVIGILKFHRKKSKFVRILFFITTAIAIIFSSIGDPYLYKISYLNGNYILLINIFVAEYYLIKFKDKYLFAPLTISFITMIHAVINSIFIVHQQYYVNYGLIIGVIGVGLSLIDNYVQMYEDVKNSLKKARTDKLTGLFNRNVIDEIDLSYKNVIFTDLDNFKISNDIMGHTYGDQKLKEVANLFKYYFDKDTIIRFGGDEFLIFTKEENQKILIEKMNFVRKNFKTKIDKTHLNVSYGISNVENNVEDSIRKADSRMYLMKNKDDI